MEAVMCPDAHMRSVTHGLSAEVIRTFKALMHVPKGQTDSSTGARVSHERWMKLQQALGASGWSAVLNGLQYLYQLDANGGMVYM